MVQLTDSEAKVLADLLRMAGEQFGNHGCNDYPMPDTPENRAIEEAMQRWGGDGEDVEVHTHGGRIISNDGFLMDYFADRLAPKVRQ